MKLGISTYCLYGALADKRMNVLEVVKWAIANGSEHLDVAPIGFDLIEQPELIAKIRAATNEAGIPVSNYSIGANFAGLDRDDFEREIQRVMKHVDITHQLGSKKFRHDVASRPLPETTPEQFDADFPQLAEACQRIADYAAQYGITTSIENHGFYVQSSERVRRLVMAVDRNNFRTTLDVGNFWCVDEDPLSAVENNLPIASIIHLKDFYRRSADRDLGEGWLRTKHGRYLRGSIAGQGDLELERIIKRIKASGYNGFISLEFEGMEDCLPGTQIGLAAVRQMWNQA